MEKNKSNIAVEVVNSFGGLTKTSKALGRSYSTIYSWTVSGRIPSWRFLEIKNAAKEKNIKLPDIFSQERVEG